MLYLSCMSSKTRGKLRLIYEDKISELMFYDKPNIKCLLTRDKSELKIWVRNRKGVESTKTIEISRPFQTFKSKFYDALFESMT